MTFSPSSTAEPGKRRWSDASLATGNPNDFPMNELTVEHWPVGA